MDKLFIKAWLVFVAFLALAAIAGINLTAHKEEEGSVSLQRVGSTDMPKSNPMITIPKGEFIMGSLDGAIDEKPRRTVYLDAYQINQYEVTQFHYAEFVKATRHRSALSRYVKNIESFNHPNQPVVYVSWEDADRYCRWRGEHLPTEAEWEKAARGLQGATWPWPGELNAVFANFRGDEDKSNYTSIVGSYEKDKSPFGLYDMSGNAREWVQDWYEEQYYQRAPSQNPKGPDSGDMKAMRGSSWNDSSLMGRTTSRMKMFPDYRDITVGFRCAKPLD
jgi:formylglycine-generating enzyme required for sulfatase activity